MVNTSPQSCHWPPALSFSAAWAALCLFSIATTAPDSGIVRRARSVFGSVIVSLPFTRAMVAATFSVPASRSTRSHDSPRHSPLRTPVAAMSTRAAW